MRLRHHFFSTTGGVNTHTFKHMINYWKQSSSKYLKKNVNELRKINNKLKKIHKIPKHNLKQQTFELSPTQQQVLKHVRDHFTSNPHIQLKLVVSGGVGAGKSFILRLIKEEIEHHTGGEGLIAAPTGNKIANLLLVA